MRVRARDLPNGIFPYRTKTDVWFRTEVPSGTPYYAGVAIPWGTYYSPPLLKGREVTSDENHKIRNPHSLRASSGDQGGEFDSVKFGIRSRAIPQIISTGYQSWSGNFKGAYRHTGPLFSVDPRGLANIPSGSLRQNLNPKGTTAIARCKPTNHVSDLAIDMFETYQLGLPRLPGIQLWEKRTHAARKAGSEYLNAEFGWKPLVSDIRNACYAAANSHRIMKSYEENSGKPVRRSYAFPVEESSVTVDLGPSDGYIDYNQTSWGGGYIDTLKSQPHLLKTTRFLRETWFSGCFTYHIPTGYIARTRLGKIAEEAGHLYGIELTPNVVWQATPWTWAIDWFSNMGDVVSNLSDWATDGLVMRYGYVMEHIVSEVSYALDRPSRWKLLNGGSAYVSPVTVFYESKQRRRATPFGFETTWNGLSLRQLAIASALGLTRVFS